MTFSSSRALAECYFPLHHPFPPLGTWHRTTNGQQQSPFCRTKQTLLIMGNPKQKLVPGLLLPFSSASLFSPPLLPLSLFSLVAYHGCLHCSISSVDKVLGFPMWPANHLRSPRVHFISTHVIVHTLHILFSFFLFCFCVLSHPGF